MPDRNRYRLEQASKRDAVLPLIASLNAATESPGLAGVVSLIGDLQNLVALGKRANETREAPEKVFDPKAPKKFRRYWRLTSPRKELEELARRVPGKAKRLAEMAGLWPVPMLADDGSLEWFYSGDTVVGQLLSRIVVLKGLVVHVRHCENPDCGAWFYGRPNQKTCDGGCRVAKFRAMKATRKGQRK